MLKGCTKPKNIAATKTPPTNVGEIHPVSSHSSGIAERRAVSKNSAKRAARGIRSPFADRDLAEQGALRSREVIKSGRELMCRSNTHALASQLVGPFGNRQREAGAQSIVHGHWLVRIVNSCQSEQFWTDTPSPRTL